MWYGGLKKLRRWMLRQRWEFAFTKLRLPNRSNKDTSTNPGICPCGLLCVLCPWASGRGFSVHRSSAEAGNISMEIQLRGVRWISGTTSQCEPWVTTELQWSLLGDSGACLGSFPLTVTVTTMGYRSYKNLLNTAPLRTVTGRGNDPRLA